MKARKILWLTWKDRGHPEAGGAEVVNEALAGQLVQAGCEVKFVVGGFPGGDKTVERDGFTITRLGNRWTVYWQAYRYYKQYVAGWADLVIDEVNTIPFFARFYVKERNIIFIHQLAREVWFYRMWFPLNLLGYLLEPLYLRMLSGSEVVTVSQSTKKDLMRIGFKEQSIHTISEGIELSPLQDLAQSQKFEQPTLLCLGAFREMKRPAHVLKAFELAKQNIRNLQLLITGQPDSPFGQHILQIVDSSPVRESIKFLGKVSHEQKVKLLQQSHLLCVTSVKEGWGLVVTEANSQGTPAVVYDVDGLRDSVRDGETGRICHTNNPGDFAETITEVLSNKAEYEHLRKNAWQWSKTITFEQSFKDFRQVVEKL